MSTSLQRRLVLPCRLGIALLLLAAGCATLPEAPPQAYQHALPPATTGSMAGFASEVVGRLPAGESAFLRLSPNDMALKWRLELVDRATTAIDLQYFIWDDDTAANLLFLRLVDAADRGVRVRLLIDDIYLIGRDRSLAALSKHPFFEIKLYNPGSVRESTLGAWGEFLLKIRQLNRRMHNKLLVADNRVAIIGGRNVGDAYFGLSEKYNFRDLDVLVAGPVIEEISHAFDEYWNHEVAYPVSAIADDARVEEIAPLLEEAETYVRAHATELSSFRVEAPAGTGAIEWLSSQAQSGEAHFLQDDPVELDGKQMRLMNMLGHFSDQITEELVVISPYLIPRQSMLDELAELTARGVSVRVLTASLASNNHTAAHAHYKKYRRRLLAAGAELFEYRRFPSARERGKADTEPVTADFVSLHTKALISDRQRCFVGSLNLDPRAVEINTENGLYIESAPFCAALADQADQMMAPENAWRVYLTDDNRLRWTSDEGVRSSAPARGFWQRVGDFFYRWLPIEGQI